MVWTATDANGNTSSCTQAVNVIDVTSLNITCPVSITLIADAGLCTSSGSIGTATTTASSVTITSSPAGPYPVGITTVIWTATDGAGNTVTCSQTVTVSDLQAPSITAPADVTVCSPLSATTVSLGSPSITDNCSGSSITNDAPSTFPYGNTTVIWIVTDLSGNTATATQQVTVNPSPVGTPITESMCEASSTNIDLAAGMPSGTTFAWTSSNTLGSVLGYNSCSSGCGTTISDVLNNLGTTTGTVIYTITPTSDLGCVGTNYSATVNVGAAPAVPSAIFGPAVVCGLATATYSVAPVPDATTYTWTVPTGLTAMAILSGQGTTSITVSISTAIIPSTITVTAGNTCGTSAVQTLSVTRKPLVAGAISGPTSACGLTSAIYSIAPVFGATSYNWTLPTGITFASGSGTNVISVNIASTFATGHLSVSAVNACGTTTGPTITITGKAPVTPGTITGPLNVCGLTTATYTVPGVAYASGYLWTVPSWMTINSGQGTTAINVTASGTPPASSSLSVAATNVCGTGTARVITLTTAAALPGAISGPSTLCGVSTAVFSVASLGSAYTYNWTLSISGWSITSGNGTTAITCTGPSTGTSRAGIVKVSSTNACASTSGLRIMGLVYCHSAIVNGDDQNNNSFSALYPNHSSGLFKLDVTTEADEEMTIQVYDVAGNLVISEKYQITLGTTTISTNLENYKNGLYFVRLVDSHYGTVFSKTIVKQ